MTYLLVYALLLLLGALTVGRPGARRVFYWASLLGLFVFVAFRYEVGCDWRGYLGHYEMQRFQPLEIILERREPGYWSLVHLLHYMELDYPYINVLMGVIFFAGLHGFARRQPDPLGFLILCLPVLIVNLAMSAIRQAAGLGFLCLAYNAFVDRRLGRYVALVLAGSLFHSSSIIFLMLVPFIKGGFSPRNIALAVILGLPGGYFVMADELEFYAERYLETGIDAAGGPFRAGLLAIVGILFLRYLRLRWWARFKTDYDLALIGSLIMLAVFPVALVSSVIGDRVGYYVMPLQLMILARLPYLHEGRDAILINSAPYVALGAVLWVWTEYSSLFQRCYVPYSSWLFS